MCLFVSRDRAEHGVHLVTNKHTMCLAQCGISRKCQVPEGFKQNGKVENES